MENEPDIAEDLLAGAKEIAGFLGPAFTERKVYHLAEKGSIPTFQLPGTKMIYARKSQLRGAFAAKAA